MGVQRADHNPRQAGQPDVVTILASFETGEQADYPVYFPMPVTITKIRSQVIKALAATDAGTVTGANAIGASTGGVLTHPLSAAIGNAQVTVPTTNISVPVNSFYKITTAKTTAGGKVLVTIEFKRA